MSGLLAPEDILDDFARDLKCVFEPDAHAKYMEARAKALAQLGKVQKIDRPSRENAINDMDDLLRGCCQFDHDGYVKSFNCYSGAKALYDAGYRKEGEQKPSPELREFKFSLEAYREIKGLLPSYRQARNNVVGDASDVDWEAEYAKRICNILGRDTLAQLAKARRPELEKEIVRIITEFRWGYMNVGRRDRPEKVAKLEKHAMTQILSLMGGEIQQKVTEAVEFIDSYLVTTVHPEGDMHHIDDKEWQSVKDRILKSEKQNGH